jgi:predicted amidohydrolase YtcJ
MRTVLPLVPVAAVALVVALSAVAARQAGRDGVPADLVVRGGRIYTAETAQPIVEAVAVRGGRFVVVGSIQDVAAVTGPATRVLELRGHTAVPGLQDAHGHFLGLGASLAALDLRDTTSVAQIVARVKARAAALPAGTWIVGRGWDQNDWQPAQWPTRTDLDAVSPDHPVFLTRIDGHAAWTNSRALAQAAVTSATADPPGGRVLREHDGAPAGVLVDTAQSLVARHIPPPSAAEIDAQILAADQQTRRLGLTMVHDAGASSGTITAYRRLIADGRLATRLYVMIDSSPGTTTEWFARGPEIDPAHRLTVRAVKLYADGALGSRGAALLEDYADEPGTKGLLVTPPERLAAVAEAAVRAGFQPCTHAIGDRANRIVLDTYERIEREQPTARALRPRIEHAQILDASDIPRFGALGVIASMQPTHCTSDMPWAPARLGAARIREGAYAWQMLLRSGARLASGSDFPVEEANPLLGFYAAVTRQDRHGQPAGGWAPDQRLTREEALRSFTIDAAFAAHAERDLGSIAVGKLADFVVLSGDIMTVAPSAILHTRVERTVIAGRDVYAVSQ